MRIKGQKWKTRRLNNVKDDKGEHCLGLTDFDKRIFYIENGQKPNEEIDTIFHEFIHAVLFELHIELDPILEETLVKGLTAETLKNFKLSITKKS